MTYRRAVLKLSGEALMGTQPSGIDHETLLDFSSQIGAAMQDGLELGIVVGGGNFWRGAQVAATGMDRASADYAGMLATIMNALALQDALEKSGVDTRALSALDVQQVAEPYIRRRAVRHLEKGRVVIFAAGTGNPYMTTDTAAALRAVEVEADVLLMAKNGVDGVYEADPRKEPGARRFETIGFMEVLRRRLEVMDATALTMCMDNNVEVLVFDVRGPRSIERALRGEKIGTRVTSSNEMAVLN